MSTIANAHRADEPRGPVEIRVRHEVDRLGPPGAAAHVISLGIVTPRADGTRQHHGCYSITDRAQVAALRDALDAFLREAA